jgi:hypothetical protein
MGGRNRPAWEIWAGVLTMKATRANRCAALTATAALAGVALAAQVAPANATITFSTFVSAGDIAAVEGQNNTIGFNYAGNKFVGSVYFGPNNLQLYSTDLTGHNVQKFGDPLPTGGGEPVLAASLGLGGFGKGDVYASGADNKIYRYGNAGGAPTLFATLPTGSSRQIFFDPGSSFGGDMIVTTTTGDIYTVDSGGSTKLLASVGADTEGMDIASSKYGKYAGDLLVASEGSQQIHAITPGGVSTTLQSSSGGPIMIPLAETVSVVPLNFGKSGNPLEGFYVANYAVDIQKAGVVSEFAPYLGDAIVTSEFSANSPLWDLAYNGDTLDTFTVTQIGAMPNQSEDGIFVTAERIIDVGVPEPGAWAMMVVGLGAIGAVLRRRRVALAV